MSTFASAGAPAARDWSSLVGSRSLTSTTGAGGRPAAASPAAASRARPSSSVLLPHPVGPSSIVGRKPSVSGACGMGSSGARVTDTDGGSRHARSVRSMRQRMKAGDSHATTSAASTTATPRPMTRGTRAAFDAVVFDAASAVIAAARAADSAARAADSAA